MTHVKVDKNRDFVNLEEAKSVEDVMKFMSSSENLDGGKAYEATLKLVEIYGKKIIPGCAKGEDLNTEESYARVVFSSIKEQLRKNNDELRRADDNYENYMRLSYNISKSIPKIIKVIFGTLIFLVLLKYLFT